VTPEQELDLVVAEPEGGHAIVRFVIGYSDTPKTYGYAAIKAGGKWYLTGPDSPQAVTWARLIGWLKSKNAIVHKFETPTQMEDLL